MVYKYFFNMKRIFVIIASQIVLFSLFSVVPVNAQTYRCLNGLGGCQTLDNLCTSPKYLPGSCGQNVGNCQPAGTYNCTLNPNCVSDCIASGNDPSDCNNIICRVPPNNAAPGNEGDAIVKLDQLINLVGGNVANMKSLSSIIQKFIPYSLAIAGFGLMIFLIIGGFSCLTSAGDPKKLEGCKQKITTALVGFVIVFTAYWITQIVDYIFRLGSPFN